MSQSNEYIHETADYGVFVGEMRADGELKGLEGYLIRNKRTGVIEGELTVEFAALRTIRELQTELEAALENKKVAARDVEQDEMSFSEMLERLKDEQE